MPLSNLQSWTLWFERDQAGPGMDQQWEAMRGPEERGSPPYQPGICPLSAIYPAVFTGPCSLAEEGKKKKKNSPPEQLRRASSAGSPGSWRTQIFSPPTAVALLWRPFKSINATLHPRGRPPELNDSCWRLPESILAEICCWLTVNQS